QREPAQFVSANVATQPAVEPSAASLFADGQILDIPLGITSDPAANAEPHTAALSADKPAEPEFLHAEPEQAIHLNLLEEREFRAGEVVTIRVRVGRGPVDERVGIAG